MCAKRGSLGPGAFLWAVAGVGGLALVMAEPAEPVKARPYQAVLAAAPAVTADRVIGWKKEGFAAVAVVLNDADGAAVLQRAAQAVADQSLDLYFWVEVGRSEVLARAHPEWMASLGSHDDWRKRFPNVRSLKKGEVARAWPWVPIRYREAFDAHRQRIERLLARAPQGYRGVLLNDLQGGPASCGCGNLQCRWATDYGVPSTGSVLPGPDVAARFLAEVSKSLKGKEVIPVWTTECEQQDLPLNKQPRGSWSTGYCGTVPCLDYCRKRFHEQWTAVTAHRPGPMGLLLLHREFQRERKEYGGPAHWIATVAETLSKPGPGSFPLSRLWLVVQGYDTSAEEEAQVRAAAARLGPGAVLVARTRIDQSYEPRIISP